MRRNITLILLLFIQLNLIAQGDISDLCSRGKTAMSSQLNFLDFRQTDNQHDYDVHFYGLELKLYPVQRKIEGRVTIGLMVIEDSINRVELDLTDNYTIERIEQEGQVLNYLHENDLLIIDLGDFFINGSELNLSVEYQGIPATGSFNFDERNGEPMIWSLSEPYGAREWWPCKDYPFDKADSARIEITVPEGLVAGSNGKLASELTENGFTTFVWKESYPITTYLISVAIHPYQIETDFFHYGSGDSMQVVHYIYPDHFDQVVEDYDKTVDMLAFYSEIFGLYPFIDEKYGHAEFPWGGGMEHQTLTSLLGPYEYLIAHELAHQWWGNMITCKDFHHIWLNEGFATYAEALWAEYKSGEEALHNYMEGNAFYGAGTIYVPDLSNDGRIFSGSLSYNKASWVLHMLRHVVGDEVFFNILRAYGDSMRKYGVATTENFRMLCEDVSGLDLEYFFEQWIYQENHPIYAYEWENELIDQQYELNLTIAQEQAFPVFKMPVDILIEMENSDTLIHVENETGVQQYHFKLPEKPVSVVLDPDNWILKKVVSGRNLINHNNNNIILSLADNGSVGFDAPNGNGNGLIYPGGGENLLYFGTVVLADGDDYLSDNDINTGAGVFNRKPGTNLFIETQEELQTGEIIFNDSESTNTKNVEIQQTSQTFVKDELTDVVFLNYKLINKGEQSLENIYFGVLLDSDIGYYLDNEVSQSTQNELIYQENNLLLGLKSLNYYDLTKLVAVRNALENFRGENKQLYMTGEKNDFETNVKDDWAMLLSIGPFIIDTGEWVVLPLAIIGAQDEQSLLSNAEYVQMFYSIYSATEETSTTDYQYLLAPNPITDYAALFFTELKADRIEFIMMDVLGHQIRKWSSAVNSTEHKENIMLSDLPAGNYFLRFDIEEHNSVIKIVKN